MGDSPAIDIGFAPDGARGAVEDRLYVALDDHQPIAILDHETETGWRVFFRTPAARDTALAALQAWIGEGLAAVESIDVPDEDWARRSQSAVKAIRIGRLTVAPPWDLPPSERSAALGGSPEHDLPVVMVIEPSTGFGTGHHATTRQCLALLQDLPLVGRRVTDVGTGSGVLAIAAAKLGAAYVIAIDNDPDALSNARDNAVRNAVVERIRLCEASLESAPHVPGDVVVANLTGAVLQREARALMSLVERGGALIVSGFGPDELEDVARAFGVRPERSTEDSGWCAAVFRF